jgi:hypothetical protein
MAPSPVKETKAHVKAGAIPLAVVSSVDLGRLLRELEKYDDAMEQRRLRGEDPATAVVKSSRLLEATAELNGIDLSAAIQRKNLHQFLAQVQAHAPVLHMSFSADPSAAFVAKLMTWLRREIHPTLLLTVGMQPSIGAGCIVRSTNHYFDFSLRKDFEKKSGLFIKALREAT